MLANLATRPGASTNSGRHSLLLSAWASLCQHLSLSWRWLIFPLLQCPRGFAAITPPRLLVTSLTLSWCASPTFFLTRSAGDEDTDSVMLQMTVAASLTMMLMMFEKRWHASRNPRQSAIQRLAYLSSPCIAARAAIERSALWLESKRVSLTGRFCAKLHTSSSSWSRCYCSYVKLAVSSSLAQRRSRIKPDRSSASSPSKTPSGEESGVSKEKASVLDTS